MNLRFISEYCSIAVVLESVLVRQTPIVNICRLNWDNGRSDRIEKWCLKSVKLLRIVNRFNGIWGSFTESLWSWKIGFMGFGEQMRRSNSRAIIVTYRYPDLLNLILTCMHRRRRPFVRMVWDICPLDSIPSTITNERSQLTAATAYCMQFWFCKCRGQYMHSGQIIIEL
jgi:hypothetical protein